MLLNPSDFATVHLKKLDDYITAITGGTIVSGELERLAVERFIHHKQQYLYKEDQLVRVLKFFSLVNIPINGVVRQTELLNYMVFWLANIYALYQNETTRLHSTVYVELSKKNSKTTTFAIAGLYEALSDFELQANCIYLASSREQAQIALKIVTEAIINSPALRKKFKITRNIITNKAKGGSNIIQVRSAVVKTIQGSGASYVLCDEYAQYPSSELADKAKSGMAARVNPLQVLITTAANNLQSPAYTMRELCVNILQGKLDMPSIFTQIFSLDDPEEIELLPTQPELYRKCNPGLGNCVSLEWLQQEYRESKVLSDKWNTFLTDNLNQWSNNNIVQEVWVEDDVVNSLWTKERIPTGATTFYGCDLARNKDLNAIAELAFDKNTGNFLFEVHNILPNNERKKIRDNGSIDLTRWLITPDNPNGYIHTSTMPVLDENILFEMFKGFKAKRKIKLVGFDPHLASQIMYKLQKQLALPCINVKQNWTLSQPISFFERLVHLGKLKIHYNDQYKTPDGADVPCNPVVRWNFQNCSVQQSKGANATLHLVKKNKEAIDSIVAMVVALAAWMSDNQNKYNDIMELLGR